MAFYASKAMRAAALAASVALALSSCGKADEAAQGGQPAGREAPAPSSVSLPSIRKPSR